MDMAAPTDDTNTCHLFITNLPPNVTNESLEKVFDEIGPLKRCFAVRDRNTNACKGFGYVTFATHEDAASAVNRKLKVDGRVITVKFAKSKSNDFSEAPQKLSKEEKEELKKKRKALRKQKNKRKGRLIIRNLSFNVNDETLQKVFGQFGEIVEVKVQKDGKGRSKGFAFLQFQETKSAIKAINALNAKEINGRPVAVDFAIPKSKYGSLNQDDSHQAEPEDVISDLKDEGGEGSLDNKKAIRKRRKLSDLSQSNDGNSDDSSESESEVKRKCSTKSKKATSDFDEDGNDMHSSDDEDGDRSSQTSFQHTNRRTDNNENTVFIRNLAYSTEKESLQKLMETFGPVKYCLLCVDDITDHPKGTAFVRFASKADMETCLEKADSSSEEGLCLDGRKLVVSEALSKDKLEEKMNEKKKSKKDNRNLYLAREGLIRQGTLAAEGVSQTDLGKRMGLQERKRRLLKNLHYFISETRLCIFNLPLSLDDRGLKRLFLNAVNDRSARITEARVMKNMKQLDTTGKYKSKGFGFVNFTEHEHALKALRKLNNNPTVFTAEKRPIIEFSIENKAALFAKQKRLEKSRLQGSKGNKLSEQVTKPKGRKDNLKTEENLNRQDAHGKFIGFRSSKEVKGLPSHMGAKIRHRKRGQKNIIKKPDKPKKPSETRKSRKNKRMEKAPKSDVRDEKSFQNLVSKYKKTLGLQDQQMTKQKWFKS